MRVLIVTSSFARSAEDPAAAAGKAVFELVSQLGKEVQGTVITPAVDGAPSSEVLGGITVNRIRPNRPTTSLANAIKGREAVRIGRVALAMRRAARQLAPTHDLVHAFWFFPAGWAIGSIDKPKIMTVPGGIETYPTRPLVGRLVTKAIRDMDLCVALDGSGEKRLNEIGARRTAQVPNCFSPSSFPVAPPPADPRLVYVGRLAPEKGLDVLLRALAVVRERRADVGLDIVGDGQTRAALEAQAAALGVSDAVRFRGALAPDEVASAIAQARMLVLPSRREGLPAAALEALSTGRPVVASAVGGLVDLLGTDYGITVPPDDHRALAGSVLDALDREWDPSSLHDSVARFDVDHAAEEYMSLYRSLTDR
jgi:glycosyltransferase involved in cell wall biosynthesis